MNIYLVTIILYLAGLISVGIWTSRRVKTSDDFMVAGRRLGVPILVGTLLATWIGSGSIIAGAGLAWRNGFSGVWSSGGALMGIIVIFFIAARVRLLAGRTVPELLESRYNPLARILAMIVTILAYTVITSYQFRAGGMILHLLTGIPLETGFFITAAFVITFTALAGMLSVAYTDFVNGVILTTGILITLVVVTAQSGGWGGNRQPARARFFRADPWGSFRGKRFQSHAAHAVPAAGGIECLRTLLQRAHRRSGPARGALLAGGSSGA